MSRTEAQALAVCAKGHFYPAYEFFAGAPVLAQEDAELIKGIPPANGAAYSPEEIQTLNEPLRMCIFTCYYSF